MSGQVLDLVGAWLAWIVAASLQVAILGVIVCVLDLLVGRKVWQEVRTALWTAVLLRILMPPGLAALEVMPDPRTQAGMLDSAGAQPHVGGIFTLWMLGVLTFAAVAFHRSRGVSRWLRDESRPVEDAGILRVLREVARSIGLRRPPELRVGSESLIPAAVGLRRHTVIVPPALLHPRAREQLEHVLLHECSHVRRRDSLWALISVAVRTLFWFHPIAWIATARLATLREIGCDQDVAVRLGQRAREYARTLASLARPALGVSFPRGTGFFRTTSELVLRLEWLAAPASAHLGWRRALGASVVLGILACGPAMNDPIPAPANASDSAPGRQGCMQVRFEVMRMLAAERASDR